MDLDESTKNRIQMKIQEGYGQGSGKDYKPWIRVGEFPSNGTSYRIPYYKQGGRICHFFSRLEAQAFFLFEWSENVVDIREQYPLLPVENTLTLADSMGIKHPASYNKRSRVSEISVMTTDFLVRFTNGNEKAYSVKMSQDLNNPRVMEKQRLEAAYWGSLGIPFAILTEHQISHKIAENLEFLYDYRSHIAEASWKRLWLDTLLESSSDKKLKDAAQEIDTRNELNPGTALARFWTLAAYKEIPIRLDAGPLRATKCIGAFIKMDILSEEKQVKRYG